MLGSGLLIATALLYALDEAGPRWLGLPASAWIAGRGPGFISARKPR